MTFEEAVRIKVGDKVYTHSGEIVTVSGWHQSFDNPCIKDDLYFHCINIELNCVQYRYDELCGPELCDEDKMFINWLKSNNEDKIGDLLLLKRAFMFGFCCGYSHKQKAKSEEQLQK